MNLPHLLEAIEARLKAATPGPKEVIRFDNVSGEIDYQVAGGKPYVILCQFGDFENPKAKGDANLLAHAPQDLAKLLAIVKCMQAALERVIAHDRRLPDFSDNPQTLIASEALAEASKLAGEP